MAQRSEIGYGISLAELDRFAYRIANGVWEGRRPDGDSYLCVDVEEPPELFHADQLRAWRSESQIVAICAGWQSGKTIFLPPWLKREIKRRGTGDYGAFSSTYRLLSRKLLPELKKTFRGLADYRAGDMQFQFTEEGSRQLWGNQWDGEPTIIQLGHAENPDSLESATLKGGIWDECGQRLVPEQSFRTLRSRMMVNRARMALASRPYEFNWYERLVREGEEGSDYVQTISFPSWANPENPPEGDEYWARLRAELPPWMFTMLYEGRYTRPAGVIYDCFDHGRDTCEDFEIPQGWNIYPGADFGPVNAAGILIAEDPHSKELYAIHEYHSGVKRTTAEHAKDIKGKYATSVGAAGNHGEEGCREAARAAGLLVDEPPNNEVDVQIQCVWEQIATRKLKFFRRGCSKTIDWLQIFSRKVEDDGTVSDKIAGHEPHVLAALRYVITKLRPPRVDEPVEVQFFRVKL